MECTVAEYTIADGGLWGGMTRMFVPEHVQCLRGTFEERMHQTIVILEARSLISPFWSMALCWESDMDDRRRNSASTMRS